MIAQMFESLEFQVRHGDHDAQDSVRPKGRERIRDEDGSQYCVAAARPPTT